MKGKRPHLLPLTSPIMALIQSMPRGSEYVFGRPITRFARIKTALDARMGDGPHWTVHDVRRSFASGLARLGVQLPVIEKILAHRSGTFKGIVGVYQQHSFVPEMTVALQKWGDHVEQLVTGKSAPVVALPRRKRT
jgi:integrase